MNIINIKSMKKYFVLMLAVVAMSCADPNLKPIVTFEDAGHGAYIRLVSESGEKSIDFFDPTTSSYTYSVDFVDDQQGGNVATYRVDLEYVDVTGANSKAPTEFKSFAASEFGTSEAGYKSVSDIDLIGTEMIAFFNLSGINQADQFKMTGSLIMNDGTVFASGNSSATVKGAAFQGHFDVNFPVVCPSDLAGTHSYSTASWCGGPAVIGTSVWVTEANGVYSIDGGDYAFGSYFECYSPTATLPGGNLRINDLCNGLFWTGASRWGETYTFNSVSVSGADLIVDWENDYGEAGITTLTREGGANWPPLFKN
jgi:hypothetical protein